MMTTPLSANQAPAREKLDGRQPATNDGVTAWRRDDNASRLLKRAAMALLQVQAENLTHSFAL